MGPKSDQRPLSLGLRWKVAEKSSMCTAHAGEETCWSPFASQAKLSAKNHMTVEEEAEAEGLNPDGAPYVNQSPSGRFRTVFR